MQRLVKRVMVPTSKDLEGRGLAVWYSRGLFDLCIISVYCPLAGRNPENKQRIQRLWQWVSCVQSMLSVRVCVIVGMPMGMWARLGTGVDSVIDMHNDDEEYVYVG